MAEPANNPDPEDPGGIPCPPSHLPGHPADGHLPDRSANEENSPILPT
jgi:hypothetical protein